MRDLCPDNRTIAKRADIVGIFVADVAFGASPAFGGSGHLGFVIDMYLLNSDVVLCMCLALVSAWYVASGLGRSM